MVVVRVRSARVTCAAMAEDEIHGRYMGDIWEITCAAMAEDERWRRAWASSEAARRQYDAPGASQYEAEGAAARGRSPVLGLVLGLVLVLGLGLGLR